MKQTVLQYSTVRDISAISLSALCVIHCLAIPVVSAMLPVGALWLGHEWVHWGLVAAAVPVTGYSIWVSLLSKEGGKFVAGAVTGLGLLIAAAAVPALHDYETLLTVAGAVLLAASHLYRWARGHKHLPNQPAGD